MMSSENELAPAPPNYVLVHGTFGPGASWTKRGSALTNELLKSEPASEFYSPKWTGKNLFVARQEAARDVEKIIDGISANQPIFVIGHSHGGSAVAHLLRSRPDLHSRLCGIAYLATPFIALRQHEHMAKLWSSLTILAGLYSAFAVGILSAFLAVAFKTYDSDALTPISLFGSAALVCLVISMTFRRLSLAKQSVAKLKALITDYCNHNETASVKVDAGTFFVRATGDEAALLLAYFQFIGLVTSRLGSFTDRALVQTYHAFGRATSGLLGKVAFGALVVCAQMWIIYTARYYGNSAELFYPWSVPDNIYIDFIVWKTPTWSTPYVRAFLYPIAFLVTALGFAMVIVFCALFARFLLSIISFRLFGSWGLKETMFLDFSVEPLPYGENTLFHTTWRADVAGEFLQHSRTYTNPVALAALRTWSDDRLVVWRANVFDRWNNHDEEPTGQRSA